MEGMEEISFRIIAAVGEAKSLIMSAIGLANEGKFDEAKEQLTAAKEKFVSAHNAHFEMIQKEAGGEKVELGLLLVHAEDQLMTTSLLHDMAGKMVEMYQKCTSFTMKRGVMNEEGK